jgi:arginase
LLTQVSARLQGKYAPHPQLTRFAFAPSQSAMTFRWLVTPYFFDDHDPALKAAVPMNHAFHENNPGDVKDRSARELARIHIPIAAFVAQSLQRKEIPVSIAGDCAATLPVMAGLQQSGLDPVLVWLDAHGDFNTIETSPSGFLGGMPLAMMVGRGDLTLARMSGLVPVDEASVWLIGARDLDPAEETALAMSQVNRRDLGVLERLKFDRPFYLHIDNDVIDARDVPANNYPVTGGPALGEVIEQCAGFAARNQICAISLSGWNGQLDGDGQTARACAKLLRAIVEA